MNQKILIKTSAFLFAIQVISSCSDSGDEPNPCTNGPVLEVDEVKPSVEGQDNGEITVSVTNGQSPYQYSLDGSTFQSDPVFPNLSANDYTLTVKDANNCTATTNAKVEEIAEVFYANQIRPIIDANCQISGCHGSNGSIPTFATYNDVKANALGIKFRTAGATMPPTGALPDNEIELIANWVDQGAPNN
jgi:hypothetical protein